MKNLIKVLVSVALAIAVLSCSMSVLEDRKEAKDVKWSFLENKSELAKEFTNVGQEHNDILGNVYNELQKELKDKRSRSSDTSYLTDSDFDKVFNNYFSQSNSRGSTVSVSVKVVNSTAEVYKMLKPEVLGYIHRVDIYLSKSNDDYETTIRNIELIEEQAVKNLTGEALNQFMSYSTTFRASLGYWLNNISKWDNLKDIKNDKNSRFLKRWWRKHKRRIKVTAQSDAAGAAAGAAFGAVNGAKIAGVGAGPGAVIGAVLTAGASSAKAWKIRKFCVVIPFSKILSKLKAKGKGKK